jgi:hypothetical protein
VESWKESDGGLDVAGQVSFNEEGEGVGEGEGEGEGGGVFK